MAAYSGTAIDASEALITAHRAEIAAQIAVISGRSQKNSQGKSDLETLAQAIDNALDDISTCLADLQTQIAGADFTP